MSTNRNSNLNIVVELTSEETIPSSDTEHTVRPSTTNSQCSICLDNINNKCYTNA